MPRPTHIETVLIVEDDDSIRRVAELALSRVGGWRTLVAYDGETALDIARQEQPDIILLDVMLPKLDGPATLWRLRQDSATMAIPVVFMTARIQAHEREHYAKLGALGTIGKPFDPMTLPRQIQTLLHDTEPNAPAEPGLGLGMADLMSVLPRRVHELRSAVLDDLDATNPVRRERAVRLAHQLAGSAGTFGSPELGIIAGRIERSLLNADSVATRNAVDELLTRLHAQPTSH
ncbi:MAG: response regulator [Nannocystaceae bacterium]|nr:response regulator [Nannocystaceae bacterium]